MLMHTGSREGRSAMTATLGALAALASPLLMTVGFLIWDKVCTHLGGLDEIYTQISQDTF